MPVTKPYKKGERRPKNELNSISVRWWRTFGQLGRRNFLQELGKIDSEVITELIEHFQLDPFRGLVIEPRECAAVDACISSNIADFQLALSKQPGKVASNHVVKI